MSFAIELGARVREARVAHEDPVAAICASVEVLMGAYAPVPERGRGKGMPGFTPCKGCVLSWGYETD